jgi:beta-glucan synthesis-associated protein KRE6
MEWYDPAGITTEDGALVITLEEKQTHNLSYQGGLMSVRLIVSSSNVYGSFH